MGSLFIVISIPSAKHEKSLWFEKNLNIQSSAKHSSTSIRPNKSFGNIFTDYFRNSKSSNENLLGRSASDDSVMDKVRDTPETRERVRAYSAVQIGSNKKRMPMEKRLEKCLQELNIPNAVWVLGRAGKYYQVSFCSPAGEHCEQMIQLLNEHEIGVELNSTVSVLPCTLYYEGKEHTMTPNKASPTFQPSSTASQSHYHSGKEVTAWERFVNSVRARLMVAQVVSGVKDNALFTFDFLVLLIIASVTAAVGLVENSVVILVASMLISPLMGPVMAGTFGFATKDWKLQNIGVLNEFLGLLLCVLIGFLYGLIIGFLSWEMPHVSWPTPEMLNRCEIRSMWVGALIALISGAAVAIAVLGNYSGSLTGVAISASLMPPAVNAGLLWALAVVAAMLENPKPLNLNALKTEDPVRDLVILGTLSLALTFINIVCIFLTGILVLKIKEVTPRGSKDYSRLLWKETLQIARNYKYNLPETAERMEQGTSTNQFPDIFPHPPYIPKMDLHQYTWSAYGGLPDLNHLSAHDLTSVWHQLTLRPPNITDIGKRARHVRNRGCLQVPSNLSRHWSEMSSPTTPFAIHTPTPTDVELSLQSNQKRFTVTPTVGF